MPVLTRNNGDLFYEIHGKGEPLLLIPGMGSKMETSWNYLLPELIENYQVITFDNRGAGKSKEVDQPITLSMMADDVIDLIKALDLKFPHIFGHSMGGVIAQILAERYGDHLGKIIFSDSFLELNSIATIVLETFINLLDLGVPQEKAFWTLIPWRFSREYLIRQENIAFLKEACKKETISLKGFKAQFDALKGFRNQISFERVKNHILIIAAADDLLFPHYELGKMAERIHNVRVIVIEGGHSSIVENPKVVAEVIKDFIG